MRGELSGVEEVVRHTQQGSCQEEERCHHRGRAAGPAAGKAGCHVCDPLAEDPPGASDRGLLFRLRPGYDAIGLSLSLSTPSAGPPCGCARDDAEWSLSGQGSCGFGTDRTPRPWTRPFPGDPAMPRSGFSLGHPNGRTARDLQRKERR
ncbi:hypothetical protein GCM10010466_07530 [Planomonospora alba]|uniref:Uncharacterized protein n=1 Tax=Planomonospora alba TaxID=161354 RepID=A0ABP6MM21_9ACTN